MAPEGIEALFNHPELVAGSKWALIRLKFYTFLQKEKDSKKV